VTKCLLLSIIVVVVGAALANAQEPSPSFVDIQRLIKPGDTIVVFDNAGISVRGRLISASATSLNMAVVPEDVDRRRQTDSTRQWLSTEVSRIDVSSRDSVWNGIAIGAGIGASAWTSFVLDRAHGSDPATTGTAVGGAIFIKGIGAALGWLIDASLDTRTTVYRSHPATQVGFLLTERRKTISVTLEIRTHQ